MTRKWIWSAVLALLSLGTLAQTGMAQNNAPLTVTLDVPQMSFALKPKQVIDAPEPVTITLTGKHQNTLNVYAFVADPTAALTSKDGKVPAACVWGQVTTPDGTTPYQPFVTPTPFGGSGLLVYSTDRINLNKWPFTITIKLRIDTRCCPSLPAATYTGQILVQAESS